MAAESGKSGALGKSGAVAELMEALGPEMVEIDPPERFHGDWSGSPRARPRAVVLPRSTPDVATALRICHGRRQSVVPQGGLTGLAGGATPRPGDIALSMDRFAGIEAIDEAGGTMTVRAGTILAVAQDAAEAAGWELGWDLGARGSCQIGGNLATNAGGNRVIRYGMARDNVLGLEAVLADGTVVSSLRPMLKNNTGYDLRHLFCGSEGTLGVITRAVLRLHPRPRTRLTALVALASYEAVVGLLRHAQRNVGGVTAYEAMWRFHYEYVSGELGGVRPLAGGAAFYVILEVSGDDPDHDEQRLEAMLALAVGERLVTDATLAGSTAQARAMWAIREAEPIDRLPDVVNFDVSLPIADIGDFAADCEAALRERWPAAYIFNYGHIGDSNLHLSLSIGPASDADLHAIDDLVYDIVRRYRGSVSAEHGIGMLKRDYLAYSRSPAELAVMRAIKTTLDPNGILNPGKLFPAEATHTVLG